MLQTKDTDWLKGYQKNKKQTSKPIYTLSQEAYLRPKDTHRLKVRGWKNWKANWEEKESNWKAKESWSNNLIRENRP